MDFTIPDSNILFSSMSQNIHQADVGGGLVQAQNSAPFFADRLKRIMGSANINAGAINGIVPDQGFFQKEQSIEQASMLFGKSQGQSLVSNLKSFFLTLSNGRLDKFKIEPAGLDTIKKMMLAAGFKETDVEQAVLELSKIADHGDLDLGQVFEKIQQLEIDMAESPAESIIAHEEAMFLESILMTFGLAQSQIQEAFIPAKRSNDQLSLDVIISRLQQVQRSLFYSQTTFQVPETNPNLKTAAAGMGIQLGKQGDGWVTLADVISSLEQIRMQQKTEQSLIRLDNRGDERLLLDDGARPHRQVLQKMGIQLSPISMAVSKQGENVSTQNPATLLAEMFKTLKLVNETETNLPSDMVKHSIKDQFDGQIIMGKVPENGQEKSFGMVSGETTKNNHPAAFTREAETIVNQVSSQPSDQKKSAVESSILRKTIKTAEKSAESFITGSRLETTSLKTDAQSPAAKPRPLPAFVTQQVSRSVVRAVNQGSNTLTIQLKPPELGRLLVNIESTSQTMRVNIMTENHAAREIISQNMTELRSLISASGISLERFEVDMSSDFRQSMADARQQDGHPGGHGKHRDVNGTTGVQGADSTGPAIEADGLDPNGSVHFVA